MRTAAEIQQIALYENPDHTVHLDVRVDGDTVWLTQQQMATLFGRGVPTISKHIHSAAKEELAGIRTISFFEIVRLEGTRTVKRQVEHYNLDMIISVGYRVKSQRGVYFRRWANGVLKQHLLHGYSINQIRPEPLPTVVTALERPSAPQRSGAAEALRKYLPSLTQLDENDTGRMKAPQGNEPNWELDYTEALEVVRSLPFYSSSTLFGRERDNQFTGIISTLYQGFGDQDLYPSVQAKAANLLYLVVKDHPFLDGNKRSAATLFIHFLEKHGVLSDGERLRVEGSALAALTLMVALSDPSEKDSMVALVENFIA